MQISVIPIMYFHNWLLKALNCGLIIQPELNDSSPEFKEISTEVLKIIV
jgi:hypothetical protein